MDHEQRIHHGKKAVTNQFADNDQPSAQKPPLTVHLFEKQYVWHPKKSYMGGNMDCLRTQLAYYKNTIDRVENENRSLKREVNGLEEKFKIEMDKSSKIINKSVVDLRDEVKSLQDTNNRLESQVLELEEALNKCEKEKNLLLQKERSLNSEKGELLKIKVNNERLIKEVEEKKQESLRKVLQLEAENQDLAARNLEINEDFSLRSKKLKEQLEESFKRKEELEVKINDLMSRINGLEYDIGKPNSELKRKKKAIAVLQRAKENLKMHLRLAENKLVKTTEESAASSKKIVEMKDEIERLQVQSAQLSQVVEHNSRLDSENRTLKEEINDKDNLLEKAEREIEDLHEKLQFLDEDKEQLKRETEALQKALKEAKENKSKRSSNGRHINMTSMIVSAGTVAAAFLCRKLVKSS